jgi:fructose-1-phosphate kinase PfkB-like protein
MPKNVIGTHGLAVFYGRHRGIIDVDLAVREGEVFGFLGPLDFLKCQTHAVVLLGNDLTGRAYRALAIDEGLGFTYIQVGGPTRSQTSILDTGHDQETLITAEGARIGEADVQRLAKTLEAVVTEEDIVVLAGPLPSGAPQDFYALLIEVIHGAGAEVVLLTGGPGLRDALGTHPEMVALSRLQCESFYNVPIRVQ